MQPELMNQALDATSLDPAGQEHLSSMVKLDEATETSPAQHQVSYQYHPLQQVQPPATMAHQQQLHGHQGAFDLAQMDNTLPSAHNRTHHYSQYTQGHSQPYNSNMPPNMAHQMAPMQPYGDSTMYMTNHPYYVQPQQMQYYPGGHFSQAQNPMPIHGRQSIGFYSPQMLMSPTTTQFYYHHESRFSSHPPAIPANILTGAYMTGSSKREIRSPSRFVGGNSASGGQCGPDGLPATQNSVRGPPRKPRQSGHALWIGNLPPQTDIMALVNHVCKETSGIESLFLILKSNCAFANFKDEVSCSEALKTLHDSKFQSVRLVSRLRKSTVEGATGHTAPTGPATSSTPPAASGDSDNESAIDGRDTNNKTTALEADIASKPGSRETPTQNNRDRQHTDKFFILKSLTTEDLDLSVQTGVWATQSHNEDALNSAFQAVDNVYLIFSANKSGEYFGYARMTSEINKDPDAAIEFAPKTVSVAELELPRVIPTEATEFAPKGRIIDDSTRGTIFWEAEREDSEAGSDIESESTSDKVNETEEETKIWGKPFKLEWLSTSRLPFYRTRGLRNPWNSNREVKIARDGTELEPAAGRKLIGLFNHVQNPIMIAPHERASMNYAPAYPSVRPYG